MKPLSPYSERLHNHYFLGGAQTLLGRVIDAHYDSTTGLVGLAGEFIIYDNKPSDELGEPNLVASNVAVVDSRTGIARKSDLRPAEPVLTVTSDQGSGNFYFGGEFRYLHNSISIAGKFDLINAESQLPKDFFAADLAGYVSLNTAGITAIASDGGNGAYIAGGFEVINGVYRQGLAQIDQNGKVTSWQPPNILGEIDSLHVKGDNIYVVGHFFYSDPETEESRDGALAISRVTGDLLSWNPNTADSVSFYNKVTSITSIGDNIYFCGSFTSVQGVPRYGLAAVNTNGDLLSWNPNTDTSLFSGLGPLVISASGDTLYLGGSFTSVNGNTRNGLAAINTNGSLLSWNPSASAAVRAIEVIGDNVYVGGDFSSVSNVARFSFAAINTSGSLLPWNPSASSGVYALRSQGSNVYAFGDFWTINSTTRRGMAAINTSGSLLNWDPGNSVSSTQRTAGPTVISADISGSSVYVGGTGGYRDSSETVRYHLAGMNSTGGLTSWDPSAQNDVFALAYHPSSGILVGTDDATKIGSDPNQFTGEVIPSINASTGLVSAFYTTGEVFDQPIYSIAVDGSGDVYVGGAFAEPTSRLAKINSSGSLVGSWNPSANTVVRGIEVDGSNVYVSGLFSTVNGSPRFGIALINSSGQVQDWKPTPGGTVKGVAARNGNVYLRGTLENFATLSGYGGIFRRDDGLLTSPLEFNSNVFCSVPDGSGGFYVGGSFTKVNGVSRSRLAQINSSGGVTSWDPNVNNTVFALAAVGDNIYIGGSFTSVSGTARTRLAAINTSGSLLAWNPSANGTVYALKRIEDEIYIGGGFQSMSGQTRSRLAAVSTNGNLLAWNPSASSTVCSLSSSGINIYIGGSFVSIGSTTRNRLAAVDTNGDLLAWDPNANGSVAVLKSLGTNIYVGGSFTSVSGTPRLRAAAVNTNGNVLTWDPSASSTLSALSVLGSNIYIGGSFTTVLGSPENLVAVFGTDGQAKSFYPELIGLRVLTISPDPGSSYVFIGGEFRGSYIPDSDQSAYLAAVDSSGDLVSWMQGRLPQGVSILESSGNTHAIIATQETIVMPTYDPYLDNYKGDPELDIVAGSRLSPLGIVTRLSDNKPIT